jgi:hypothetical protein
MKKAISILCISISLFACNTSKSYPPAQYAAHMEQADNHYTVKQTIGDHEYTIQLATPEYMVCKEIDNSDSAQTQMKKRLQELKGQLFFLIKIGSTEQSRKQKGGNRMAEQQQNVNEMVAYYDQQAILDISLENGNTTLKPNSYLFENNYDLSPHNTIVVGFDVGDKLDELKLNFNDRYTNIPAIRATFSQENLRQLPTLDLNN